MAVSSGPVVRGQMWLDRWLCLFTEVRKGEGAGALLLAANVFCLLASYYLLKTVREALILAEGGAEVKSYAAGAQAMILLLVVPAYGAVASRVNRIRLINGVMLFFVSHLVVFHQLAVHGVQIGVPFFLWVGIFNLVVVAQFWAFANDLYTHERGQRLFPLVGIGASIGALVGARLASGLMVAHAGPPELLLIAAFGLMVCIGLTCCANQRERSQQEPATAGPIDELLGPEGGFRLIVTNRYLRLIALMVILLNVVNTIGEFMLGKLVVAQASRALVDGTAAGLTKSQLIGIFYGDFFGWVNLVSLFIQLFVVSRVFKRVGVRGALFVLPLVAFVSYGGLVLLPVLAAVRLGKIFENSTDYSLQNTARHALFLPTSREAKYKAKQAIDGFFWRVGDVLQAIFVFIGARLAFGVPQFALLNQLLVVIWLAVSVCIYREHKSVVAADEPAEPARAAA
jgi:AAA family ATP:ADP antiporter